MTASYDKTDSVKPRVNTSTSNVTTTSQITGKTEIRGKEEWTERYDRLSPLKMFTYDGKSDWRSYHLHHIQLIDINGHRNNNWTNSLSVYEMKH